MRVGDVLNGYRLITAPTSAGGGMSQRAFAERDGKGYFVKMFLAPKFPAPDGPGSAAAKERKRSMCIAFEQRHLEIARRLDPTAPGSGNLVVPRDFFRVGATYVKVMDRIDASELPPVRALSARQLVVILRTLAFSVRVLHQQEIVHGDIKPDNVLVERGPEGLFISKLIDFDEAYLEGAPPPPELVVGDPLYYSPELLRYIKGDASTSAQDLRAASDIFSLGVVVHDFLAGDVPDFDRTMFRYPCEALVMSGIGLDVSHAPEVVQPLLGSMLALASGDRPTIDDVVSFLAEVDAEALVPEGPPRERYRPPVVLAPAPVPDRSIEAAEPADPVPPGVRSTVGRRRGASVVEPSSRSEDP